MMVQWPKNAMMMMVQVMAMGDNNMTTMMMAQATATGNRSTITAQQD